MYYSANWQLLEEQIDDDALAQTPGIDRRIEHIWGPPEVRYIDDIIARRRYNFNTQSTDVWYHLTDALFSTVAIIDEDASLVERVSYDAYGRARHHRLADLTGDGAVTTADRTLLLDNDGNYGVGDLDRSGVVDSTDLAILQANAGAALADGQLSSSGGTDNIIGFAGYVFNAEHAGGGLYTVRFRVYSPDLGRWLTRDPIGYVDGMGLYEYVRSRPNVFLDPSGLRCGECEPASTERQMIGTTRVVASGDTGLLHENWKRDAKTYIHSVFAIKAAAELVQLGLSLRKYHQLKCRGRDEDALRGIMVDFAMYRKDKALEWLAGEDGTKLAESILAIGEMVYANHRPSYVYITHQFRHCNECTSLGDTISAVVSFFTFGVLGSSCCDDEEVPAKGKWGPWKRCHYRCKPFIHDQIGGGDSYLWMPDYISDSNVRQIAHCTAQSTTSNPDDNPEDWVCE